MASTSQQDGKKVGMGRHLTDDQLGNVLRDIRNDPKKWALIKDDPLWTLLVERAERGLRLRHAWPVAAETDAGAGMREIDGTLTADYDAVNTGLDTLASRRDLNEDEKVAVHKVRDATTVGRTRSYRMRSDMGQVMIRNLSGLGEYIDLLASRLPDLKHDLARLVTTAERHWKTNNARAVAKVAPENPPETSRPRDVRALTVSALEMLRTVVRQDVATNPELPREAEQIIFATLDDYPVPVRKRTKKPVAQPPAAAKPTTEAAVKNEPPATDRAAEGSGV